MKPDGTKPDGKGEIAEETGEPGGFGMGQGEDVPAMAEGGMGGPGAPDRAGGSNIEAGNFGGKGMMQKPDAGNGAEWCAVCLLLMVIVIAAVKHYRRIPGKKHLI